MDLVTQAYIAMQPNAAREAATILNDHKTPQFKAGVDQHYPVNHSHGISSTAMALLTDRLESNGFEHLSHENNTNVFRHKETGKHISVVTTDKQYKVRRI